MDESGLDKLEKQVIQAKTAAKVVLETRWMAAEIAAKKEVLGDGSLAVNLDNIITNNPAILQDGTEETSHIRSLIHESILHESSNSTFITETLSTLARPEIVGNFPNYEDGLLGELLNVLLRHEYPLDTDRRSVICCLRLIYEVWRTYICESKEYRENPRVRQEDKNKSTLGGILVNSILKDILVDENAWEKLEEVREMVHQLINLFIPKGQSNNKVFIDKLHEKVEMILYQRIDAQIGEILGANYVKSYILQIMEQFDIYEELSDIKIILSNSAEEKKSVDLLIQAVINNKQEIVAAVSIKTFSELRNDVRNVLVTRSHNNQIVSYLIDAGIANLVPNVNRNFPIVCLGWSVNGGEKGIDPVKIGIIRSAGRNKLEFSQMGNASKILESWQNLIGYFKISKKASRNTERIKTARILLTVIIGNLSLQNNQDRSAIVKQLRFI